jgi:Tol biopolymer transport system component
VELPRPLAAAPAPLFDPAARRTLTHAGCAYSPAFLEDDAIVYDLTLDGTDDVYLATLDGAPPRQLTSAAPWEWRPSRGLRPGEVLHVVYDPAADGRDDGDAVILDRATGTSRVVLATPTASAIVSQQAIYYASPDLSSIRRLIGDRDELVLTVPRDQATSELAASRDGAYLAFTSAAPDVDTRACVLDLATRNHRCLARPYIDSGRMAFSRDERSLYFAARDGIRRMSVATLDDELVVPDVVAAGGIAVSDDGRHLVWSSCTGRGRIEDVSVSPPEVVVEGTDEVTSPLAGPDGLLAYADGTRLMIRDRDGTSRQVTRGDERLNGAPAFSADGARLAFAAEGARPGLYVTDATGMGQPVRLTENPNDERPVWIDAMRIAFTRHDERGAPFLHVLDLDTMETTRALSRPVKLWARDARTGNLVLTPSVGTGWLTWDPTTGRVEKRSLPGDIGSQHVGFSPSGNWMVISAGRFGHRIYRARLDVASPQQELVYGASETATIGIPTIDDDGHVYTSITTWTGDLHVQPASPGRTF